MPMLVQYACYRMHTYRYGEGLPRYDDTTYDFVRLIQQNAMGGDAVQGTGEGEGQSTRR